MKKLMLLLLCILLLTCSREISDDSSNPNIELPLPQNVILESISLREVKLSWSYDLEAIDGFLVEESSEGSWQQIAEVSAEYDSLHLENVAVNKPLQYRITAYAGENQSQPALSNVLQNDIPAVENAILSQLSVRRFLLQWQQMHIKGEDGFLIERRIDEDEWQQAAFLPENSVQFTDDILRREFSTISYKIYCICGEEKSAAVDLSSEIDFPSPAELVCTQLAQNRIKITWQDFSNEEEGFAIDRCVDGFWTNRYGETASNDTVWIDENASVNHLLQYRLYAFCGENTSSPLLSEQINNELEAPSEVTYQKITLDKIKIFWNDNSEFETGFAIDKRIEGEAWQNNYGETAAEATCWTDSSAQLNQVLQYRVAAICANGSSEKAYSPEILNYFHPVVNFEVTQQNVRLFHLSWEEEHIIGEEGFTLNRSINEQEFSLIALLPPDSDTYSDDIILRDTISVITWKIRAFLGEDSNQAVQCSVAPFFPPPSDLFLQRPQLGEILLTWQDNSEGEDGFVIDRYNSGLGWIYNYAQTQPDAEEWLDTDAVLMQHLQYRVKAVIGSYCSDYEETYMFNNSFSTPNVTSCYNTAPDQITFTWEDDLNGEDGFCFDKEAENGYMITQYAVLPPNTTTWTDTLAEINMEIFYRFYAIKGEVESPYFGMHLYNYLPWIEDLEAERINVNTIQLNWTYEPAGEDGIMIDRHTEGEPFEIGYALLEPETYCWTDTDLEIDTYYLYRLYTCFGEYISYEIMSEAIPTDIPAPEGLQMEIEGDSLSIYWDYSLIGIDGFQLGKSSDEIEWQTIVEEIDPDLREWQLAIPQTTTSYRMIAFYQEYQSDYSEIITYTVRSE